MLDQQQALCGAGPVVLKVEGEFDPADWLLSSLPATGAGGPFRRSSQVVVTSDTWLRLQTPCTGGGSTTSRPSPTTRPPPCASGTAYPPHALSCSSRRRRSRTSSYGMAPATR